MTSKRQGGTLDSWFVFQYPTGEKVVIGVVSGDQYWWDQEVLRTSEIVELFDNCVETRNTIYQLGNYFNGTDEQYNWMLAQHGLVFYGDYESVVNRSNLT